MNPTDEELDRDWKPNGRRPQSTIARSFSQELMDIFRIENSIADLDEQIDKRKQQVTSGQTELEALEARIKEMEERLKKQHPGAATSSTARSQRQALSDAFDKAQAEKEQLVQQQQRSRPGTAKQVQQAPAHGGAMPPTPTASEGEYVLVNHSSSGNRGADSRNFTDYVLIPKDGGDREN
ncbi:uncharacterized protein F4807DRAFT_459865 [Annulohypoxylon truncatum]|uniref:uncharacterized protein n=1 Tax=Annulohypoxylon truncatum TaxID=327061 RepID=UPI00200844D7|nr:uncharacterized protein F4807DRAFT_459865 [Annulohypoxylon truncatum]KAI1210489.1 hypothetical protein F4807DRAFT_459865 [Annulohypoxylon truncatum]